MADNYVPQKGTKVDFIQQYPQVPHRADSDQIVVGRWVRIVTEDDGTAASDWFVVATFDNNDFVRISRNGKTRAVRKGHLRLTGW
jgi:hypothetical protein